MSYILSLSLSHLCCWLLKVATPDVSRSYFSIKLMYLR